MRHRSCFVLAALALCQCATAPSAPPADLLPRASEAVPWVMPVDLLEEALVGLIDPGDPAFLLRSAAAGGPLERVGWRWDGWEHALTLDAAGLPVRHDVRPTPERERGGLTTTRWERDAGGRLLRRIATTFEGDRVEERCFEGPNLGARAWSGPARGPGLRVAYRYAPSGRLARVATSLALGADAYPQDDAAYDYDAGGRPVRVAGAHGATLGWDASGRLLSLTFDLGRAYRLRRDPDGRLREILFEDTWTQATPRRVTVSFGASGLPERYVEAGPTPRECDFDAVGPRIAGMRCAGEGAAEVVYVARLPQ